MNIKRLGLSTRVSVYEICLFVIIFENIARGLLLYAFDREL